MASPAPTVPGFHAPWWLAGPHAQTVYGSLAAPAPSVALRRERWDTPDGDFVDVDFLDGPSGSPWIHLFHGLEGSSRSRYARAIMAQARGLASWSHEIGERLRSVRAGDASAVNDLAALVRAARDALDTLGALGADRRRAEVTTLGALGATYLDRVRASAQDAMPTGLDKLNVALGGGLLGRNAPAGMVHGVQGAGSVMAAEAEALATEG